jgi:hypothetical protein
MQTKNGGVTIMTEKQNPKHPVPQPKPAAPQPPPADLDEYIFRHEGGWQISDR